MEDTAAEPAYLAVIDNTAEADYIAVMDDISEPGYVSTTDGSGEAKYVAAACHETFNDTSESTPTDVCEMFSTVQ